MNASSLAFALRYNTAMDTIRRQDTGAAVEDVQHRLSLLGILDESQVTGTFDEATAMAVLTFCKRNDLGALDEVNEKVWAALVDATFCLGDRTLYLRMPYFHGNDVLQLQQALGALGSFTVGVYKVDEKKYYANSFEGSFEIVSLTGTIDTMNGEFYTHLHLSAGNDRGEVFGGHLNRAEVSATCEMVIRLIDGRIDRQYDEVTGLNLFKFL